MDEKFPWSSVLDPLPPEQFVSEYWGQKPFSTKLNSCDLELLRTGFYSDDVPELLKTCRTDENAHYTAEELTSLDSELENSRKTINMPFCFAPGAIELRNSFLESCGGLGNDVEVGVYLSRTGGDIAHWHMDNNHNITIQLDGVKEWRLMAGSPNTVGNKSLIGETPKNRFEQVSIIPIAASTQCYSMSPGSVLYLPAGYWHQVTPVQNDCLSVDIRIGNLVEAKWIAEAVFSGLLDHFGYAKLAPFRPMHVQQGQQSTSLESQLSHVVEQLPLMMARAGVPRCLPSEPTLSDGLNRAASLEYLRDVLPCGESVLRVLSSSGSVVGMNVMVAMNLVHRDRDCALIQLRSVSSLSGMEYMRFDIVCNAALFGGLQLLVGQSQVPIKDVVDLCGPASNDMAYLIALLWHVNVLWYEYLNEEQKPKKARR